MSNVENRIKEEAKGIRPKTLKRFIILDILIDEYVKEKNERDVAEVVEKEEVVENLTPGNLRTKIYDLDQSLPSNFIEGVIGLADRTLKDYIEVLKHFRGAE